MQFLKKQNLLNLLLTNDSVLQKQEFTASKASDRTLLAQLQCLANQH